MSKHARPTTGADSSDGLSSRTPEGVHALTNGPQLKQAGITGLVVDRALSVNPLRLPGEHGLESSLTLSEL